ncbi:LytR C-terminal domain-containing protein [Microlunatus sp. Gsoil 973]|uniref:LytR C-terminal domain-containing protein n=1 Tax=Microlunatus sp. Gsoil 973 TaxID=2672569 RepID=UPI0012B4D621|nr:LytR C-terminal domain-containing protein [Microlunatus sp. Gsoil 973]QGN34058.1 LytR family transcriptional regulator [Microlunatus sp. Gsoil 973]
MVGRVFRIIRTPLTLLILLAILCYGAWWGWKNIIAPPQKTPPPPCVPTKVTNKSLKSSQVTVRVYNGGDKKGLAGDVTRSLRAKGFNVLDPANTDEKVSVTVIVGNAAKNPEVRLVRSFFKGSKVRADGRTDHTVDVLVGNRPVHFNSKAKTSYPVKTRTVCLPQDSTSAPTQS